MEKFNFKRRNLFLNGPYGNGPHLLGIILIPIGLCFLLFANYIGSAGSVERTMYVGIGALIIGLIIVSTYGGTLISFKENKIKNYYSICGIKTGEWSVLPKIALIELNSFSYKSTNTPNGISPTLSGTVIEYKASVYSENADDPVISFRFNKKNRAIEVANLLSTNFNANLETQIT